MNLFMVNLVMKMVLVGKVVDYSIHTAEEIRCKNWKDIAGCMAMHFCAVYDHSLCCFFLCVFLPPCTT